MRSESEKSRQEDGGAGVGHTDNQGSFDHNLEQSSRRALAVKAALAADCGVDGGRQTA